MPKFYYLKNETEFKIIRALIEELNAEKKIVLLTIRIMNQITNSNCDQIILESENTAKEKSIMSELFDDVKKEFLKGTRTTFYN